ncbi:hypothetical protein GIS00_26710 [Nakamurella sp. YIM 132087]|uniref:Nuclear transport factor 2 family protein n=1 Tax=Nakamurella alba TaxID=2665158 RepID=A0A7K1FXG6_9ACTN|nr:hypothetical protein [Nakamurella alba]MTD17524.1 hypothetical protein [Nakamurella alba]
MTTPTREQTEEFFDRYARALLARDEQAIAGMYGVPALILGEGIAIPVTDEQQTADFFASSWPQYAGVDDATRRLAIMGSGPGTVWADVTWTYSGGPRERFCYQLAASDGVLRIVVLTPLELDQDQLDQG